MKIQLIVLIALFGLAPFAEAKNKSSAQDLALFRVAHRTAEGIKGGFFSGAAGYIWHRMAFGNRTPVGVATAVGVGAVSGFFGNWANAKREYDQKKLEQGMPVGNVERVGNTVFSAYAGGILGNLATRYATAKQIIKTWCAPRYGALAGAGLGLLWSLTRS